MINYFHYVDDILIFDSAHTDIHSILTYFNSIQANLHFTSETEQNNAINYLGISIHNIEHNVQTAIYKKPTFTDTIIPYSSNHPIHINMLPLDTSIVYYTHSNYIMKNIIVK